MKMGTTASPWRYDGLLESTLSAADVRPGSRNFYARRRLTEDQDSKAGMGAARQIEIEQPRSRLRMLASVLYCTQASTEIEVMRSTTFTVRVDAAAKKRLERLAKDTGRSRSFLAAEAINDYLDVNEWQVAGIKRAVASLDRGEGVSHERVKDWVESWGSGKERPIPKSS
jgi:RHH-type rel operon transcriptional repressor/antitoxin RelB